MQADVSLLETLNGNQGGQLVDEFRYSGCMLKNDSNYEKDVHQRCAKANSTVNLLTKCLLSTPIANEVKLRVYLSAIRPIMMYGSVIWAAPSTVMEKFDCLVRKLFRRMPWLLSTKGLP
ncbi:hypothetical protein RB195_024984 [Necator americanus]|uniref:Reverse transcriptase domain-containing protein n=1 Tax=Necator americanus TaxID=51031 RepID=A0ABR1EQD8_NECAM